MTTTLSLDAHIIVPKEVTKLDALINGDVQVTTSLDAILYPVSHTMMDAILVSPNTNQKSVAMQTRTVAFKSAILGQEA